MNDDFDNNWEKLYWADFIVNKLYFSFWDEKFNQNCEWKEVNIRIKWTWKYTFLILDKKFINTNSIDNKLSIKINNNIHIIDNEDLIYQEMYEILSKLNKRVKYYEIDEERRYIEKDIFTSKTKMIELYK